MKNRFGSTTPKKQSEYWTTFLHFQITLPDHLKNILAMKLEPQMGSFLSNLWQSMTFSLSALAIKNLSISFPEENTLAKKRLSEERSKQIN